MLTWKKLERKKLAQNFHTAPPERQQTTFDEGLIQAWLEAGTQMDRDRREGTATKAGKKNEPNMGNREIEPYRRTPGLAQGGPVLSWALRKALVGALWRIVAHCGAGRREWLVGGKVL